MLLLTAGGYAPQLSVHAFLGLIGLWLLMRAEVVQAQPAAVAGTYRYAPLEVPHA